jgi:hypothetical protein
MHVDVECSAEKRWNASHCNRRIILCCILVIIIDDTSYIPNRHIISVVRQTFQLPPGPLIMNTLTTNDIKPSTH